MLARKYFDIWAQNVEYRKHRRAFYEIKQEEQDEIDFAQNAGMDPIYWCWNCKYSDCDRH